MIGNIFDPDPEKTGAFMLRLMKKLYPICRSITGNGVRETLGIIGKHIPLEVVEVPSGTKVFDWTVPPEWNIRDAYIRRVTGEKVVDFRVSNLHVLNYSVPVKGMISLEELKQHLHTLPEYPDWIPYLSSYYRENWGFCLSHNQMKELRDPFYDVCIDSTLAPGSLTYGECLIRGESEEEIVFSTYVCHPSLCNDNLSGPVLVALLAKELAKTRPRYSYRFLFIPETIGAITWLAQHEEMLGKIRYGFVVTCVGDRGPSTYQRTRSGTSLIDTIAEKVLADSGTEYRIRNFTPISSDERQYSSPGINLPFGSLMRTTYDDFPEYHTSSDNLGLMDPLSLADSYRKYLEIVYILENNSTYLNLNPRCEPQMGRRGLYDSIGGRKELPFDRRGLFWVMNFSDGEHSLLDIAIRSGLKFREIRRAADILTDHGLLRKI
ncbi:MAG: DUF4910 domain-containing protein [Methanoregula sp.]|jgi:aminopeptidase-like protein|uniref:DUF4910 domain-containing protein n=1 Tax=Methanoregula sp. TaxID=2052170 RepID=UPI003D099ED6